MSRTFGIVCLLVVSQVIAQQSPTSQPILVNVTDKLALDAAIGKEVIIQGTISGATWSRSGAVMNIDFAGAETSRFLAVVFQRSKADFDAAFSGDAIKSLVGAKVRLKGKLEVYGGQQEAFKGRPQIILDRPDQVTVVEPATKP